MSASSRQQQSQINNIETDLKNIKAAQKNKTTFTFLKQKSNLFGVYSCLCVSTIDYYKQNRVKFFSPILNRPDADWQSLPYAYPLSSFGGFDDSGVTWVPPAGSTIMVIFEASTRKTPYYLGTTWSRTRNSDADGRAAFDFPVPEYDLLYQKLSKRDGYLCGDTDGSQNLPPWNTENYNGYDIDSLQDIETDPSIAKRSTYPNIYGFKTPEKHMLKMVDGDAKCNRRWKRLEIMSGNGNWMIFKDDPFHYGGQWSSPKCGDTSHADGDVSCIIGVPNPTTDTSAAGPAATSINNQFDQYYDSNTPFFEYDQFKIPEHERHLSCDAYQKIPSERRPDSQIKNNQVGKNPFFKNANECRPYRGPQTPQNNKCDLPQTGIQLLSLSGHSWVMDDSVEAPVGNSDWHSSLRKFDFGCTDKFLGRTYWVSATGHKISMNDIEAASNTRGAENGIKLLSANGNEIFLCDEGTNDKGFATVNNGIRLKDAATNTITLSARGNKKSNVPRKGSNPAQAQSSESYIEMRTGYGLSFEMVDQGGQKNTVSQYIRLISPQKDNQIHGPHILSFVEKAEGPGQVLLRSGGSFLVTTTSHCYEIIGWLNKKGENERNDLVDNSSDKLTYVSRNNMILTGPSGNNFTMSKKIITISDDISAMFAGKDYDQKDKDGKVTGKGPGCFPVVVWVPTYDSSGKPTGRGVLKISDRFFSSTSPNSSNVVKSDIPEAR
jgi:hypothetical protein